MCVCTGLFTYLCTCTCILCTGHSDAVVAVASHPTSESNFITTSRVIILGLPLVQHKYILYGVLYYILTYRTLLLCVCTIICNTILYLFITSQDGHVRLWDTRKPRPASCMTGTRVCTEGINETLRFLPIPFYCPSLCSVPIFFPCFSHLFPFYSTLSVPSISVCENISMSELASLGSQYYTE